MKYLRSMLIFAISFNPMNWAQAAKLNITFSNPKSYTDIRPAFDGMQYSTEDITSNIEKYLTTLAEKLPQNYLLKMNVTDIDLAGDTRGQNIRLVMQHFSPRLAFSFQLLDENSQVLLETTENIRDSAFMSNQSLKHKNDFLGYEKKLLDDWLKETFSTLLNKP